MKRLSIFALLIILLVSSLCNTIYAQKEEDLFDLMINNSDSKVEEYGIVTSFKSNSNDDGECKNILIKMGLYEDGKTITTKTDKIYCIEINKDNISGYIEKVNYENNNMITLNLIKKDNKNNLGDFKKIISDVIDKTYGEGTYFMYIKAKCQSEDLVLINNKLEDVVKEHGGRDIQSLRLDKGFTTTAFTNRYSSIRNNGRLIDLNYSVSKYDSGNYVVIGTPEILISY